MRIPTIVGTDDGGDDTAETRLMHSLHKAMIFIVPILTLLDIAAVALVMAAVLRGVPVVPEQECEV